jgi:hypothetical protein
MDGTFLEPWIPPAEPDPMRLALEAADEAGRDRCDAWPAFRMGGVAFGDLPPFLAWHGVVDGRHHLVLLQAREAGGLVPGARARPLPEGWLAALDLEALAAPLARHPAFAGGAAVHVAGILGPGEVAVRSYGGQAPAVVEAVLARVTAVGRWRIGAR